MEKQNISSEDEGKTHQNQEESSDKNNQKSKNTQPTIFNENFNNLSEYEFEQNTTNTLGKTSEDSEREKYKNNSNNTLNPKSDSIFPSLGSNNLNNLTNSKKMKKEKTKKKTKVQDQDEENINNKETYKDKETGNEIEIELLNKDDNEEQDEYHHDDKDDDVKVEDKRIVDFQNNKELYKKKYTDLCSEIDQIKLEIMCLKTENAKYEELDELTRKHYKLNQQKDYGLTQKENMKFRNIEKRERELLREHKKLTKKKIQRIANKHNRKKEKKKKKSNFQSNNNKN
ncbi:hypothetical protein M0813_16617 [Anaeramoeba flamelloides]|uniref:Uncharacterized protein n=1 Tax=Anaeramoeba flamelloides TaxID=1746091 RepID=A0ABQ8YZ77_9EUKA|nr:hypothetical protein M0813_16617 [Anaeramoeba flamelloides]